MGRIIIKYRDSRGFEKLESLKCKSLARAEQIAAKRPHIDWNWYGENTVIPQPKKKKIVPKEVTKEELEIIMRQQGLI